MSLNKLYAIGRLTADPVLSTVGDRGIPCANFTLACDTRQKDANGNKTTNFYRVQVWRVLGETCAKYLHKGDKVSIVGDLSFRTYTNTKGEERSNMEVSVTDIEFLNDKRQNEDSPQASPPRPQNDLRPIPKVLPNKHQDVALPRQSQTQITNDEDDLPF